MAIQPPFTISIPPPPKVEVPLFAEIEVEAVPSAFQMVVVPTLLIVPEA
jgi:hypothetical protein